MKSKKNKGLQQAPATASAHAAQQSHITASPLSVAVHRALREMTRRQIAPLMALSLAGLATPAQAQDAVVELSALDGSSGFVLNGVTAGDRSGGSVSAAGDVNGDGVDDLLIGALGVDPNGTYSGASYVVFGTSGVGSSGVLELSALDGSNGFVLNGVAAGDRSGVSVSAAGDVNGDGVDDLLIGADRADPNGSTSGASYVVFGASGVGSSGSVELSALDGSSGFVLNGVAADDFSGRWVSAAGDVNGDGVDDLLIGAYSANPNGSRSGASYVVFGASGVGSSGTLELSALDGSNGFVLNGVAAFDLSGRSVSAAGDVNGDGVDDLLIGAYAHYANGSASGASYVVFGASGVGSSGTLALSALDGSSGFVLNGVAASDFSGRSVSAAGDVNGDGVDDLLIGASGADPNGSVSGASYVVFGASGVGSSGSVELSALDGSSGFVLNGVAAYDRSGSSVSAAGDVNGDGVDDLLIGAYAHYANGSASGASYVVFGASDVGSGGTLALSALDGSSGFVLNGVAAGDFSGRSVSAAGDVNGDGVDDLLIGARGADPNGSLSGASYVVFGVSSPLELSALDGNNGFVLNGVTGGDYSGRSVSAAGDVNGDGVGDLLIGASRADPNGSSSGASYVVFGASSVGSGGTLELSALDGSSGFVLNGVAASDFSGRSVSAAGDVNGDGVGDLLIGAFGVDPNGTYSGASYVVFGASGVGSSGTLELSALDGSSGFVLNGVAAFDNSGRSVSGAGDVNGDGVDDLLIGAYGADPNGSASGASYVVFGASDVGSGGTLALSALDSSNGFVLKGVAEGDRSGYSVSAAGDVNGDGVDDLLIGADNADPNGNSSGASYVVFGASGVGSSGTLELSALDGSDGFVLNGVTGGDNSGRSVSAAGDVNGDGVDDLLIGADFADPNGNNSGASYVVFGASGVGSSGTLALSALDGSDGFVLNGVAAGDYSGRSVSAAGDVNGDGVDDLLIGASRADPNGISSGASYVVFGASGVGSSGTLALSALDGSSGFVLNGVAASDRSGRSVSAAGDVNGDGVDDLLIGAYLADPNGYSSGASYVVFGEAPPPLPGSIKILKNVVGSDFTSLDFDFMLDGVTPFTLSENDPLGYEQTGLTAGTYSVVETVPSGWTLSSIDCGTGQNNLSVTDGIDIVLEAGEDVVCTFNNTPPAIGTGQIGDFVWQDNNGNGRQDAGEPGVEGVTVNLWSSCTTTAQLFDTTLSDGNGAYLFEDLPADDYQLEFIKPSGYTFSPKIAAGDYTIDSNPDETTGLDACRPLAVDQQRPGLDAGLIPVGGPMDTLMVLRAIYYPNENRIWIKANSDALAGSAIITATAITNGVETVLGQVGWKAGKSAYQQAFNNLTAIPDTIKLVSDQGGMVTAAVEGGGGASADTLTVVKAIYFSADDKLWIKADSDASPAGSATITAVMVINGVETVLGDVPWKPSKNAYQQVFKNLSVMPDSIILNSNLGGTVAGSVSGQ